MTEKYLSYAGKITKKISTKDIFLTLSADPRFFAPTKSTMITFG